jgi:hypothetical protein
MQASTYGSYSWAHSCTSLQVTATWGMESLCTSWHLSIRCLLLCFSPASLSSCPHDLWLVLSAILLDFTHSFLTSSGLTSDSWKSVRVVCLFREGIVYGLGFELPTVNSDYMGLGHNQMTLNMFYLAHSRVYATTSKFFGMRCFSVTSCPVIPFCRFF